jgi:hypothetical protein
MKKIYLLCIFLQIGFSIQTFSQTKRNDINSDMDESTSKTQGFQEAIDVTSFPNPASKSLTFSIQGVDFSKVEIEIFELTGQPVMTLKPDNAVSTIDVSGFKEGIYFYKVVSNDSVIKSEKFIVLKK